MLPKHGILNISTLVLNDTSFLNFVDSEIFEHETSYNDLFASLV